MKTEKDKSQRLLTDPERREMDEYFDANSGYFQYIALLFLTSPDDAEDVIQESFLHAMRHIDKFLLLDTKRRNVYIARTIYNLCVDDYRRKKQVEIIPLSADVLEGIQSQKELVPGSDTHLALLDLGARMQEREWYVLQQLYLEGASKESVAKALGCTTGSIRSIASRARASARKLLKPKKKEGDQNG